MDLTAPMIAGATALVVAAGWVSADNNLARTRIVGASVSAIVHERGRHMIEHDRVIELLRARHVRYIGQPYLNNGRYVIRCYDDLARLSYCFVDPYSGKFLGISLRL